jgi:tRNA threonylcarbamoyladenosine biosynthesis protein TsaB
MSARFLILETSCRVAQVAVAEGSHVLSRRTLDEARRHARDLTPAVRDLLNEVDWSARSLSGVIVSRGPGSYTGLRVGLMSAKALAYATGCAVLAIDTFAAVAQQAPEIATRLEVLADAQQDRVYVQGFLCAAAGAWQPCNSLSIVTFQDWLASIPQDCWISGPGIQGKEDRLQDRHVVPAGCRLPQPEGLLHLALERYERGERDDSWTLEPLYLRPSAAELQWDNRLKS